MLSVKNPLTLDSPCLTRNELVTLSGFRLPARAGRQNVPGLTLEQVRTLERYGAFQDFTLHPSRKHDVVLVWGRRKRGQRRLYSMRDVLVARLVAWMLRDGLTMREAILLVRGSSVRVTLSASTAEVVYAWRWGANPATGAAMSFADVKRFSELRNGYSQPNREWQFPLEWLGFGRDVLPRVRKLREQQPTIVTHRRPMTPAEIVAEGAQQVAL